MQEPPESAGDAGLPRRIVVVNDTSRPVGGTAVLAIRAVREFRARGLAVTLLTGDEGNPRLAAEGVEVVALGERELLQRKRLDTLHTGLDNPRARRMVADWIAANDAPGTVYHLHAWAQILSPSVFAALAPVAERTFVHAHDYFIACPNGVYTNYRRGEVCELVPMSLACILSNCDKRSYPQKLWRVARQARVNRAFDKRLPWAGVIQIHPGMQPKLERGGIPATFCHTVRNPADPWTTTRIEAEANDGFLFVGRLEPDKGVLALAAAARRTQSHVTFVGDGPARAQLEAEFPEFPVTGWVARDEVGRHAARARAVVVPSLHAEPFGLVVAEAICSGLPALVANAALMAPEVAQQHLGFAFDPRSEADFDTSLRKMRDAPAADVRAMSEAGFSGPVRLALSTDEWIVGLLALYREALLRQRPAR